MDNPWLELAGFRDSYVLKQDEKCVAGHNKSARNQNTKVIESSIPEPFIGNPDKARVVFLGLNPGHSEDDEKNHRDADFSNAMFRNLHHELEEYPFYPLNPAFKGTGAGKWWRARTRKLREESRLDDRIFAERMMVIEWFPYHSVSFARPKTKCESQEYSFQLARRMLEKKNLVVLMRSRELWTKEDLGFGQLFLSNPQCGYITRGNTDGHLFEQIVNAVR